MNMTQLVVGTAIGFLAAQGVVYFIRRLIGWVTHDELRSRMRTFKRPSGREIVHASLKYSALLGAAAALTTLGVWATGDYFTAKSARGTAANDVDTNAAPVPTAPSSPGAAAPRAPAPKGETSTPTPAAGPDPYADPEFKVQRAHRAGTRLSLKDTLVQRAEAKARGELLGEMRQHQSRSQYDCEAAERAARYLKAGLDVWGFAAWQVKHFPMDSYDGATLSQCQQIKDLLDPSHFDLHDAVVQGSDPGRVPPHDTRHADAATPTASEGDKSRP